MQIYLDYSATTPPREEAIASMHQAMTEWWGNPSSLHQWGERAALVLERARAQVAALINAAPETLVFTTGGTEADNLAILGVAQRYTSPQHLVISSVEHSAVDAPVRWLECQGWAVTRLSVDGQGRVDPAELERSLQPNTALISVIYGQSEVGTLQPIDALGAIARRHGVLFHTDAVQVAGRCPIDVQQLPVDLLSLSSHKLYGPPGAGALYVRPRVSLEPQMRGGGQEFRLRSGTQALPAIAGFGTAAEFAAAELQIEQLRLTQLRDQLFNQLAEIPDLVPTGDRTHRLPHHASFYLRHGDGDRLNGRTIVRHLNLAGIGISAGSACNSGKLVPSPTLLAMGLSDRQARSGIRFTLGRHTTSADIEWTATVVQQIMERVAPAPLLSAR